MPSLRPVNRGAGSLGFQLAQRIRAAIVSGELKPGDTLPSSRALALSLGLSRGTVVEAFEQLAAEGRVVAGVGVGTRIASHVGTASPMPLVGLQDGGQQEQLPPAAARLAAYADMLPPQPARPFAIAVPAAGAAPNDRWRRLGNQVRASMQGAPSGYADPRGAPELRQAIAEHVRRFRAVSCGPENVVVTAGTQQGLYMAAHVLLSPGDGVWAEDPAYPGLTAVLHHVGAVTYRIAVDDEGLRVDQAIVRAPEARAAFVTPSHQYPIGVPLSMGRRKALVAWAERTRGWIVEDDYDSELRYAGHPFPAMQGMAPGRVVYLGTFSKGLFPSLRLGYVVAPAALVDAFVGAHALLDRYAPTADQHALAAYLRRGFFEAHVRRIRTLYGERRAALLSALNPALPDGYRLQPSAEGTHLLLWGPPEIDDVALSRRLGGDGIVTRPISPMYATPPGRSGLMLGFGGFAPDDLKIAAGRLIKQLPVQPGTRPTGASAGSAKGEIDV